MYFSRGPVLAACLALLPSLVGGAAMNTSRTAVSPGNSHSLPESYQFNSRDGWESVMVTNLRYKYRRSPTPEMTSATAPGANSSSVLKRRLSATNFSTKSVFRSLKESLAELTKNIVPTGKVEPVTITWYTGHDLLHPSCWAETDWAPTDNSFVAALTLDGWLEKPKCFKFIELCRDSTKCTFARVVDTCAGCQKGSRHVDLTRAAFEALAPLNEGVLTVQMRQASDPTGWSEKLWGPKDI